MARSLISIDDNPLERKINQMTTVTSGRGTSFKYAGVWDANTHYNNDDYRCDFVACDGILWACKDNHISNASNKPGSEGGNAYWDKVLTGVQGKAWVPYVEGDKLKYELKDNPDNPAEIDLTSLKGKDGKDGRDGTNGTNGRDGKNGNNGLTYRPDRVSNGQLYFRADNGAEMHVDISSLKGDKGDTGNTGEKGKDGITPTFVNVVDVVEIDSDAKANARLVVEYNDEGKEEYRLKLYIPAPRQGIRGEKGEQGIQGKTGRAGEQGPKGEDGKDGKPGQKGEKGDKGDPGVSPTVEDIVGNLKLELKTNEEHGGEDLYMNGVKVGDVGGKSPKLVKLMSTPEDPEHQDDCRHNDRIVWGYDGVPVSEWTTLCYLWELKGDQKIEIGKANKLWQYNGAYDSYGGPADHHKIWFDLDDEGYEWDVRDFLYHAYTQIAGINAKSKSDFEKAFMQIPTQNVFFRYAETIEDIPKPYKQWYGNTIFLVESEYPEENNLYDKWIVIHGPSDAVNDYKLEMFSSPGMKHELEEANDRITALEKAIEELKNKDNG